MGRRVALLFLVSLAVYSLLMVNFAPASAQSKPSVPEFTVEFVDFYDVPPTYEVDPNTGETVVTQEGFRSDFYRIVVTIQNQPFTSYTDEEGNIVRLYYYVYYKFDFDQYWHYLGQSFASDSECTEFTAICGKQAGEPALRKLHPGDKLCFKVQARIGTTKLSLFDNDYISEVSDWSEIQTLTIPDTTPSIMLISPQNGTFNTSNVTLDFAVDNSAFLFKYSLDGGENVTVSGNTTLTELAYGHHNITVYARDRLGNIGASETIYFNVEKPPTALIVFVVIIVAVISAGSGLLIYHIKRK
jgi:hypothetical protein